MLYSPAPVGGQKGGTVREEEQRKEEEELQNILEENFAGWEQTMVATREQMDRDKRRKLGKVGSMRKQKKRQKEDDHKRGRKKLKYEVTRILGPSGPVNSSSCGGLARFARKTYSLK